MNRIIYTSSPVSSPNGISAHPNRGQQATACPATFSKAAIAFALLSSSVFTTSCALVSPETEQKENTALADKYNYMKRFQELQAQIDMLQSENARLSRKYEGDGLVAKASAKPESNSNDRTDDQLHSSSAAATASASSLTEKAEKLLGYIDSLIEKFSSPGTQASSSRSGAELSAAATKATESPAEVSGVLIRDESNQVVASIPTGSHDTGEQTASWNYSVVYRYQQEEPWNLTWDALEAAGEVDKWKGINAARESYFIYVGVYATENMARKRQSSMKSMIGMLPDVDIRRGNSALASN